MCTAAHCCIQEANRFHEWRYKKPIEQEQKKGWKKELLFELSQLHIQKEDETEMQ